MFKNPFSFQGRIRRLEYGISYLISIFLISVISGWDSYFSEILYVNVIYFSCAQGAKRAHDIGYTGWLQFIPLTGIVLLFEDSLPQENEYGISPKGEKPVTFQPTAL